MARMKLLNEKTHTNNKHLLNTISPCLLTAQWVNFFSLSPHSIQFIWTCTKQTGLVRLTERWWFWMKFNRCNCHELIGSNFLMAELSAQEAVATVARVQASGDFAFKWPIVKHTRIFLVNKVDWAINTFLKQNACQMCSPLLLTAINACYPTHNS